MSTDHRGTFELLPAIDLRGGRVVRLQQGDFDRETAYDDDPVAVASRFARPGATWLHVVDLDGARAGEPRQLRARRRPSSPRRMDGPASRSPAGSARSRRSRERSARAPPAWSSGRPRCAIPGSPRRSSRATARTGSWRRSTSATGSRSGRAGATARQASRRSSRSSVSRHAASRPSRSPRSTATACSTARTSPCSGALVALGPRPDHRLGRDRVGGRRARVQAVGCAGAIVGRALYEGRVDLGRRRGHPRTTPIADPAPRRASVAVGRRAPSCAPR